MNRMIVRLKINALREAIRSNRISFPSQVPVFPKHDRADLQRKVVQLYFLLGWTCGRIGARYGLCHQRVQQILNTWKLRAVQTGYLQVIPQASLIRSLGPLQSTPRHMRICFRVMKSDCDSVLKRTSADSESL